jgi:hypothetical protein
MDNSRYESFSSVPETVCELCGPVESGLMEIGGRLYCERCCDNTSIRDIIRERREMSEYIFTNRRNKKPKQNAYNEKYTYFD